MTNVHVLNSPGHVNEKNFVGLATDGDYITCGSENNGLYVYYKGRIKLNINLPFSVSAYPPHIKHILTFCKLLRIFWSNKV